MNDWEPFDWSDGRIDWSTLWNGNQVDDWVKGYFDTKSSKGTKEIKNHFDDDLFIIEK